MQATSAGVADWAPLLLSKTVGPNNVYAWDPGFQDQRNFFLATERNIYTQDFVTILCLQGVFTRVVHM
jgi:hypothetical protein